VLWRKPLQREETRFLVLSKNLRNGVRNDSARDPQPLGLAVVALYWRAPVGSDLELRQGALDAETTVARSDSHDVRGDAAGERDNGAQFLAAEKAYSFERFVDARVRQGAIGKTKIAGR
jgi:hypothetical protein